MNTKKSAACAMLLCVCAALFCISAEYKLANVPADYKGAYLPVRYDTLLNITKNHFTALYSYKYGEYHDLLLLQDDVCYSDVKYHDGYAIYAETFAKYRFVSNTGGAYIIDDMGNWYKRIGLDPSYHAIDAYIASVIFTDSEKELLKRIQRAEAR